MFFNKTRRKLCTKVPIKIPSFSKSDKKREEAVVVYEKGGDSPGKTPSDDKKLQSQRPYSCGAIVVDSTSLKRESSSVSDDKYSNTSNNNSRPSSYVGAPLASFKTRTLVRPRPWRFWQRNKMGNSLERDKAPEEDTTLEGDSRSDTTLEEDSRSDTTLEGDSRSDCSESDSTPDSVSDSSNATITEDNLQKLTPQVEMRTSIAEPAEIAFELQKSSSLSRGPLRKSDRPKVVTFSENESSKKKANQEDFAPPKSVVVNVQEKALKISFQKPEEVSLTDDSTVQSPTVTDAAERSESSVPFGREWRRSQETAVSPKSPVEDVLFSMGYTIVEDKTKNQDANRKQWNREQREASDSEKEKAMGKMMTERNPATPTSLEERAAQHEQQLLPGDPPLKKLKEKKSKKANLQLDKEKQHSRLFSWKTDHSAKHKTSKKDSHSAAGAEVVRLQQDIHQDVQGRKDGRPGGGQELVTGSSDSKKAGGLTAVGADAGSPDRNSREKASVREKKSDTRSDGTATSPQTPPSLPSSVEKPEPPLQQQPVPQQQQQQPQKPQQQTALASPQQRSSEQLHSRQQPQHPLQEQLEQQPVQLQASPPQPVQQSQQTAPPPKPPHLDDVQSPNTQTWGCDSPYGSTRSSLGRAQGHISESDGEITPVGTLRRGAPRRHTVGGADIREQMEVETERKREAFYDLLAHRYPEYAYKITGVHGHYSVPERTPRSREPLRRRTTVVTYNPHVYGPRVHDYEDPGTMSDLELPSFQRGGYARASLPAVRSTSMTLERSLGLVFLLFRDETKKAVLPNEITSLDTVRAMFVRAFPEKLTMEFLDSPKRKIYILEAARNIFFQLEDLRDIKDRTVLKIHECESTEPQRIKCHPEVRGRTVQSTSSLSRPSSRQGFPTGFIPVYQSQEEVAKTQSLPISVSHNYQDLLQKECVQWEMEQEYGQRRSRSQTPEPAERPRSLSTGAARTRFSHSPDRLQTPERPQHLNPIPENPRLLANGFREAVVNGNYDSLAVRHPQVLQSLGPPTGHHPQPQGGRVLSPQPVEAPIYGSVYGSYPQSQPYITRSTWAGSSTGPHHATVPSSEGRDGKRSIVQSHLYTSMPGGVASVYDGSAPQCSPSYRVPTDRELTPRVQSATSQDPETRNRMERMEAQLASLAAWVHHSQTPTENIHRGPGSSRSMSCTQSDGTDTLPSSTASSLSDIPSASYSLPQPVVTAHMQVKINSVQHRLQELRKDLQGLRRMEQLNQEAMRDAFNEAVTKFKKVVSVVPGAENLVLGYKRLEVTKLTQEYSEEKSRVEKELSDLEASVEELKQDVLARRCRISANDVEAMAVVLSNITKSLADLKGRFPDIQKSMKNIMAGEMEIVVREERFLKEEPAKIEDALKRCKKLTGTLYTLKRLALEQDQRPLQVPLFAGESKQVSENEKMAILESIRAMVPDHKTRVQSIEAADASRERKKMITTKQEVLKFTKTLQTASKSLKPSLNVQSTRHGSKAAGNGEAASKSNCMESQSDKTDKQLDLAAKPPQVLPDSTSNTAGGEKSHDSKPEEVPSTFAACETTMITSASTMHAATTTSQATVSASDNASDCGVEPSKSQRSAARLAFFSSHQSSSTSPTIHTMHGSLPSPTITSSKAGTLGPNILQVTVSPTAVTVSQARSSGMYYQLSPTSLHSILGSIPLSSQVQATSPDAAYVEGGGEALKLKKVPPPPPPRKSSAKFPFGHAGGVGSSTVSSEVKPFSSTDSQDSNQSGARRKNSTGPPLLKSSSFSSPLHSGVVSSMPKPVSPQKPAMSRFQKDIAAGIYANMNRPDLQNQKVPAEKILGAMPSSQPVVDFTSGDGAGGDKHSESESTGSTTSLDSQQGLVPRSLGASWHRSKPEPPQRNSSLLTKLSTFSKTSQKTNSAEGELCKQTNGLDGKRNGHKT